MFSKIKKLIKEHRELKYLAYHDSLTQLKNRNWLYKNMQSIDRKYVYFVDINDLKLVNLKGHTFGDAHINYIVDEIKLLLKVEDIIVRYAGDEFIVFSNMDNLLETNELYSVGVYALWKHLKPNVLEIKEAINIADKRMIKNKYHWKNR